MAEENSVAAKGFDKVASILEKLVDNSMLVLWLSFILYLDIWLIATNTDIGTIGIDSAITNIRMLNIRTIIFFIAIFSVLMSLVFPSIRYTYCTLILHFGNFPYSNREKTPGQQKLSNWAAGAIGFGLWNFCAGSFAPAEGYRGLLTFIVDQLGQRGLVPTIFSVSFIFLLFFCIAAAFDKEY